MNYKNILKRETKVIAYVVIALTLVVIGASYALFLQVNNNSNNQVVEAGSLVIEYSGGNKINVEENAENNCLMPMSDEDGETNGCKYTLSITNRGTLPMVYDLLIYDEEIEGNQLVNHNAIKHTIKKQKGEKVEEVTSKKLISELEEKENKKVLEKSTIEVGETIAFTITIWIDETKGEDEVGNLVSLKLDVVGSVYEDNTLVGYIKSIADNNDNLAYDGTEDNNLRYIGANPNNYVKFNNEIWRIIGVMNNITDSEGNVGSHIKIIRNESIGSYSWDNKASGTGSSTSSYGSNDWTDSALMNVLNNGAYYNRTSGNCPKGQNGATTACDFSSNGLTEETKRMIANVVWKLGGHTTPAAPASAMYGYERGSNVYSGRPTEWTGRIGLMYSSDYGYAVGGSSRTTCLGANLSNYKTNNCNTNDWLYKSNTDQWLLVPYTSISSFVFNVTSSGYVNNSIAYITNAVFPVLYLASNVEIIGGDGTQENAFELSVQ